MKKIFEDLNIAKQEVPGKAAQQAKQKKLVHVGFGRYADSKSQQVTHISLNDNLVPFNTGVRTNTFMTNNMDDYGNFGQAVSDVTQQVHQTLIQTYSPEHYDDMQLDAIYTFTNGGYVDINNRLSILPTGISPKRIERNAPDDTFPELVDSLDSAMKKSRAPIDFITYMALGSEYNVADFAPGVTFQLKTFRDTSINISTIITSATQKQTSFAGRDSLVILQLNIKKNSKGMYISDYSSTPEECEFLLPRGTRIEIVSGPNTLVGSDAISGNMNLEVVYFDCIVKT
jgi:hypothetical protein